MRSLSNIDQPPRHKQIREILGDILFSSLYVCSRMLLDKTFMTYEPLLKVFESYYVNLILSTVAFEMEFMETFQNVTDTTTLLIVDYSSANLNQSDWLLENTTRISMLAPTFNQFTLIKTLILATMAVMSFAGNFVTLMSIKWLRTNSTVYFLISQLAFSDVLVSLFCLTTEAIWTYTVQWFGGTLLCKLVKYLQVFSLYLSTYVLVSIALDRYMAVRYPMKRNMARQRCRLMLAMCWIFSAVLSTPQLVIFQVQRGPFEVEFYQCVTHGFYTAKWQEQLYTGFSFVTMFVIPLFTITVTYFCTFCSIASSEQLFRTEETMTQTGIIRRKILRKAKVKSLKITVVIVLAFVLCWTPYFTMMLACIFMDPNVFLSKELQSGIFFFGMSNSLVNPLIYGAFHLRKTKRSKESCKHTRAMSHTTGNSCIFRKTAKRTNNRNNSVEEVTSGVSLDTKTLEHGSCEDCL